MTQQNQNSSKLQKIISHPRFKHFILYCSSQMLCAQVITSLGPMFPYLAVHQNKSQTEYSFLFISRGAGFIFGSILMRIVGQMFTFHKLIALSLGIMSISCILFGLSYNQYLQGLFIFSSSLGIAFQNITLNIATLDCFKDDNPTTWLQILGACFGLGGLIGPFIVYSFQLNSFQVIGFLSLISIIFYFKLQTPEKMVDVKKIQQEDNKKLQLPQNSIYLIAAAFLFIIGQQVSYGGWISSYAVLWNFSKKQHATLYSSVYWISITFFRFVLAAVPGTPLAKMKVLTTIGIVNTFISYFIIFNFHPETGLIFMSIVYGLSLSALYPLSLSIPQQFGFQLTIKENSIFVIWASLGQGCLAVFVGKLMQWFSYNWMIYSVGLFNIAILVLTILNQNVLITFKSKLEQSGKLQRFIKNHRSNSGEKLKAQMQNYQNIQLKEIKI